MFLLAKKLNEWISACVPTIFFLYFAPNDSALSDIKYILYFLQDNKVYGKSGQTNGNYGWLDKHTSGGANIWGIWTDQAGYTIQESDSYLRLKFCTTGDHGTTWRANNWLIRMTVDNFNTNINNFIDPKHQKKFIPW